jgi:hypothetical protein
MVALTGEQRRARESRAEVKTGQCGCDRRQNGAWFLWRRPRAGIKPRHVGRRPVVAGLAALSAVSTVTAW